MARRLLLAAAPVAALALAGVWLATGPVPVDPDPQAAPGDAALAEKLAALGYAEWVEENAATAGRSGVTRHDPGRTWPGLNLFNSRLEREAFLLDMEGRIVHRWAAAGLDGSWQHIELGPAGDLFVIAEDGYLARLDWDSRVLWKRELRAHHDLAIGPAREIYVLDRQVVDIPHGDGTIPIVDDGIAVLEPDGSLRTRYSIHALFGARVPGETLEAIAGELRQRSVQELEDLRIIDIFHTNTVEVLDRDLGNLPTKGDILICVKRLDLIAIVDLDEGRIEWSWGPGELDKPHQPTLTADGRILVFDNGTGRGYSRVVEVDPLRGEIVWQYEAEPRESFYSETRGGSQKLPNGNVLVTEANRGRVFEVTRDGQVVWEFYNPNTRAEEGFQRGAIYRMTRIDESAVEAIRALNAGSRSAPAPGR